MEKDIFKTPESSPKIKAWRYQYIGIPFLLSIPILALLGFFGGTTKKIQFHQNDFSISLDYPDLLRNGQTEYVQIKILNTSIESLKNFKVHLNSEFLQQFDEIEAIPSFDKNIEVSLEEIPPNEQRFVFFKLKANKAGPHYGRIEIKKSNEKIIQTALRTFVLP